MITVIDDAVTKIRTSHLEVCKAGVYNEGGLLETACSLNQCIEMQMMRCEVLKTWLLELLENNKICFL